MRILSGLLSAALVLTAASTAASAATLTLASYGTVNSTANASAGVGASNTALNYSGYTNTAGVFSAATSTSTYNIPTVAPWVGIAGSSNSTWVSYNNNTYPGGSIVAPSGTYTYSTTFQATADSVGTITVAADDTTSIYLNNVLVSSAASLVPGSVACTAGTPTCTTAVTYNLTGFVNGTNKLRFGVVQNFGGATGLDFAGTVNTTPAPTPEPSSLALLATGLVSAAGAIRRRIKA